MPTACATFDAVRASFGRAWDPNEWMPPHMHPRTRIAKDSYIIVKVASIGVPKSTQGSDYSELRLIRGDRHGTLPRQLRSVYEIRRENVRKA